MLKYKCHTRNTQTQNTHNQQSYSIRVFSSNVRGLVKNWDAVKQINTLNFDILLFSEIWQIKNFEHLIIPEFVLANIYQREQNKGGGVIIFVRNNIVYEKIESPIINGVIETISIKINNNVFTSIYRPPSGSKQVFTDELIAWNESLGNKNVYIAGDFNLNYLNQDKTYFEAIEHSTGLKPSITGITRVESSTCIDNILTNLIGSHKISSTCIADHQGLISSITISGERNKLKRHKYREMKESNWSKFSAEITNLSIKGTTIDEKWRNLSNDIKRVVEKSFPEKSSNKKYLFTMSQGLIKSKNKKNKLLKQYKRGIIAKEVYTRYNKIYRKLIIKEQESNFKTRLQESGTDSKKKWRVLKEEIK